MNNLIEIYTKAIEFARANNQVVGEKNNYYITLEQLEALIMVAQDKVSEQKEDSE